MSVKRWTVYESPIGPLTVAIGPHGITDLSFPGRISLNDAEKGPLPEVTEQLDAYFAGELRQFDLPLDPRGAPLQKAVWRALLEIPYGQTASYGEQAARIDPSLFEADVEPWQRARVVGAANGQNPIAIDPLPPRDRRRRLPHRLRRRPRAQAGPARPREQSPAGDSLIGAGQLT
jgi:methylated-DNA-[protein]-cysteine S-methyltransferase